MKLLKKINQIFDYVYYRTAKRDLKNNFNSTLGSCVNVVALQLFSILTFFNLFMYIFFNGYEVVKEFLNLSLLKLLVILLLLTLGYYNYQRYNNNFQKLDERWKNESGDKRKLHGYLIILSLIFSIITMILSGLLLFQNNS